MSHVITHFNSCPEYSKMSLMQTSKWLDKTLCICNLHIRGCGKANTLMSACWLQFLTVKQKNDHVFSRWQKTVTWGIRPISQRPATSANWDRVPDIHPQFLRRWQLVDGKCEGLQRPIKTARNTIHLYWQLRSIHVHVQLKLKLSQIHPKSKLSTNI